jgi:phosphatidylserine/phosphatidylglycerophosphate/cardiolipin synthase-like enzyme
MDPEKKPPFRFSWREGNRFELLVDGVEFFPRMLRAINDATRYIYLEMYLVESGEVTSLFIDSLLAAARRNVEIYLLLDHYGSAALSRHDLNRLARSNIHIAFYNKFRLGKSFMNLARDHRKLLLIDGQVAFVGGAGLTDEFAPLPTNDRPWRETMVRIEGPVLADWEQLFAETWSVTNTGTPIPAHRATGSLPLGMLGRVAVASGLRQQGIMVELIDRIRHAERRVWLATAYFVPSGALRRALVHAVAGGVDVRLLLPGPQTDHPAVRYAGRRYYGYLLSRGIRIYEYQPRVMHSKTALCDDWVSLGSSNFDRWNLRWNLEANQIVEDGRFAHDTARMFEADIADSVEIRFETWAQRPLYYRLRERFWGKIDILLHRIGRGRNS